MLKWLEGKQASHPLGIKSPLSPQTCKLQPQGAKGGEAPRARRRKDGSLPGQSPASPLSTCRDQQPLSDKRTRAILQAGVPFSSSSIESFFSYPPPLMMSSPPTSALLPSSSFSHQPSPWPGRRRALSPDSDPPISRPGQQHRSLLPAAPRRSPLRQWRHYETASRGRTKASVMLLPSSSPAGPLPARPLPRLLFPSLPIRGHRRAFAFGEHGAQE